MFTPFAFRRNSFCPIDCLSFLFEWEKSSWRICRIRIVIMNESGFTTTFNPFEAISDCRHKGEANCQTWRFSGCCSWSSVQLVYSERGNEKSSAGPVHLTLFGRDMSGLEGTARRSASAFDDILQMVTIPEVCESCASVDALGMSSL